jgi:hypothetical protein
MPFVDTDSNHAIDEYAFKLLALSALVFVVSATVVYRWLEDWSWVDSLYFSVVAITTVGFGDLTPSTDASKLFTVGYLLVGISLFTTYLSLRFRYRATKRAKKAKARKQD